MSAVGHLNHAGDFLKAPEMDTTGEWERRSEVQRARVSDRKEPEYAHGPLREDDREALPRPRAGALTHSCPAATPPPGPVPRPLSTDLFVLVGQHDGVIRLRVERVLNEHLE